MNTDRDTARDHMTEIIQWWPILDDVADSLLGVTGHGVTLDGVRSDATDSATELAVLQLDQIDQLSRDMVALARKFGWRPGRDGNPRIYIHANLDWASANLAPIEWTDTIHDLHKRISRLTGHAPRPTGKTCPACGENQLALVDDGMLHCPTCDETRDPDEITALTNWRLIANNATVTRKQAATILGEPENTIKQRIRRRNPDYETINGTRHYTISDLKPNHVP